MSRDWIVDRMGAEAYTRLAREMTGSALQSLLLEVVRERAKGRTPAEVLAQYQRDGFVQPTDIDQRTLVALDAALLAAAGGFEAVELAPVAPLGACSSVALTDQHRVLSALRSTEVVADPTNVLALECAQRMRADARAVHLTTCQRVIRAQALPKAPGFTRHFRIYVLASGGIETQDHGFTVETLVRHVRTMLASLEHVKPLGYAFGEVRLEVLATPARARLADRIAAMLPGRVERGPLEHGYYDGLRYRLWATTRDGEHVPLADGGAFDWLKRLTSNRRAVFIASGAGAELIPRRFRAERSEGHSLQQPHIARTE